VKFSIAESLANTRKIDLVSGEHGLYQTPIDGDIVLLARSFVDSDAVLVPHDAYYFSKNKDYMDYLRQVARRKLLVFSDRGDFPKNPRIENSVALRVALNPGESIRNKIIVPYNVESLEYLDYRRLKDFPKVSFVGYLPRVFGRRTVQSFVQTPTNVFTGNGALVRKSSVLQLENMKIEKEIIKRKTYGGHVKTATNLFSSREEYKNSIQDSDFILSPRGDANQSARFYEVLSCGRLPLVPNTGVVFPLNISQKSPFDIRISVPFSAFRTGSLDQAVWDAWRVYMSDSDYHNHQYQLRELFKEYLNFNSFLKSLFQLDLVSFLQIANPSVFQSANLTLDPNQSEEK
jgi:hypothetical protein